MKTKIGAVYNVFDGEELLEDSIKSIREKVDYVLVICQTISNFGNEYKQSIIESQRLYELRLVDEICHYTPSVFYLENGDINPRSGAENEQKKRNIGLEIARERGCTHLLMMDSDEFYSGDQFDYAWNEILEGNYDSSFCQMTTYYKEPTLRLEPKETYYVPFIIKLHEETKYGPYPDYSLLVDPTRRTKMGNVIVFSRDELEMHHFSYVRKDIRRKLTNSSSVFPRDEVEDIIKFHTEYKKGGKAFLLGQSTYDIVETENLFNIKL